MRKLQLESINKTEALRYMGQADYKVNDRLSSIMDECEQSLLEAIKPRYTYRCFDIEITDEGVFILGTSLVLKGDSIRQHLLGCKKVVLEAATLSMEVDNLIRRAKYQEMIYMLTLDCMASAAIEQVMDMVDDVIREEFSQYNKTFRFGIGYGDLSIQYQKDFLKVLNANKLIGLNVTQSNILTPRKSVTAIIGLSKDIIEPGRRGCASCNMNKICAYRKKGGHCNV